MDINLQKIDIFCHVIDNYGDGGVVYRIANELTRSVISCEVRIFTDDIEPFSLFDKRIDRVNLHQKIDQIEIVHYSVLNHDFVGNLKIPDLIIEAFACFIPDLYINKAKNEGKLLINLDYLMAEDWVESFHKKESLLGYKSLRKFFFMPGFTESTGGLIQSNTHDFEEDRKIELLDFVDKIFHFDCKEYDFVASIFTYEHDFSNLVDSLDALNKKSLLIVFGEKSKISFKNIQLDDIVNVEVLFSNFINQNDYDKLVSLCDFNFVRGEDSLARASLSSRPFFWHCYLEKDGYQKIKVEAFVNQLKKHFNLSPNTMDYFNNLYKINDRLNDSYLIDRGESYTNFLENIDRLQPNFESFSNFLRNNCNLISNLLSFIRSIPTE
ncbi:MAG: elongation factor P maturation arginine rhamnosyltransferase EarP [Candidatus Delongbacteria bacterium]|nr:elongation factor P maturation arginine rhamnosyltransferase EarP [Candidatus Delongbacteria bacterium]MBN2834004.1 elongation factor P maturation arginine rhamnosyltransferase EarP [Candidatus Delongbacteria bacterium]